MGASPLPEQRRRLDGSRMSRSIQAPMSSGLTIRCAFARLAAGWQVAMVCSASLGGLACAPVGSLGKDFPHESSTTSTTGMPAEGSTTGAPTSDSSGEHGEHGSSTSTGSSTGSATDHASGTDDGTSGDHACAPAPKDDECVTCTKTSCCEELSACATDPVCTCIHECHAGGTPLATCMAMCGDDGGANDALELCVHELCMQPCA